MSYIRGGKFGKLGGFDYYLRSEGKLRPNERIKFLIKSENYIGELNSISTIKLSYMDADMSDDELLQIWNEIWWNYGYGISELRDKWHRERFGIYGKEKTR